MGTVLEGGREFNARYCNIYFTQDLSRNLGVYNALNVYFPFFSFVG